MGSSKGSNSKGNQPKSTGGKVVKKGESVKADGVRVHRNYGQVWGTKRGGMHQ